MTHENFYAGNTEYVIIYKNGTHHIMEIAYLDNGNDNSEIIFTGHYEKCLAEKERIITEYAESLF